MSTWDSMSPVEQNAMREAGRDEGGHHMGPRAFAIRTSDIGRCPLRVMLASHYNPDGSCRCPARNALGYLNDSTPVPVTTSEGVAGVMPAWLAEAAELAGVAVPMEREPCRRCGSDRVIDEPRNGHGLYYVDRRCLDCDDLDVDEEGGV